MPILFYAWLTMAVCMTLLGGGLAWFTKRAVERVKNGH